MADDDLTSIENNPAVLAAIEKITSGEDISSTPPSISDPIDGPVTLPAGFRRIKVTDEGTKFVVVTKAWVRELNGEDEEKISKARLSGDPEDFIEAVLTSGVVKFDDASPTKDDFDSLFMGDREFLLMEIGRATYGDTLEYFDVECPHCREKFGATISLSEDVPVTRLKDYSESSFDVTLRNGRVAHCTLPLAASLRALAATETPAEANTLLIAQNVSKISGKGEDVTVQGDEDAARRLGLVDRQTIVDEMYTRMPGPDYNGVRFEHSPGCGKEVRLAVTLADLFRTL